MLSTGIIIILAALGYGYLAWRMPRLGLAVLLLALPAYGVRATLGPLPINALDAFEIIFIGAGLVRWYQGGRIRSAAPYHWLVVAVALAGTLSWFVAPDWWVAAGFWKSYIILPLGVFLVLTHEFLQPGFARTAVRAIMGTALYIAAFAVFQKLTGGWFVPTEYWIGGEGERVTSIYSYANAVGLFVGPIAILALGYAARLAHAWHVHRADWQKEDYFDLALSALTAVLGVLAVWWAKSDGAIVGMIAGLVVMGLYHRRTRIVVVIMAALAVLIVIGGGLPELWQQKLLLADWSGQVRLTMWRETWQMLQDHWFWGAGLGGYPMAFGPYHLATYIEIFWYPHNIFLNFWSELGLLGLVAMIGGTGQALVLAWHRRWVTLYVAPALGALVVIIIHGLVDVPYFKGDLAILWWLVFALIIAPRVAHQAK